MISLGTWLVGIILAVGAAWGLKIKVQADGAAKVKAASDAAAIAAADKRRKDDAAVSAAGPAAAVDWLREHNRK